MHRRIAGLFVAKQLNCDWPKVSLLFIFIGIFPFRPKKIKLGRRYLVFIWFGVTVYSPFLHCPGEIKREIWYLQ